jgi:hypothetical protein
MRTDRSWMAPLTGLAFIVVLIVGFVVVGEPPVAKDSSPEEIVNFYADNNTAQFIGAVVLGLAAVLFVFFGSVIRGVLREKEPPGGNLSLVAFAGTIIFAVGAGIDGTLSIVLADSADDIDPVAVQAIQAIWDNDFLPLAIGLVTFWLATGISVLRYGALPRWIGWVALLIVVVSFTPAGFGAFLAGGLLVAITSVLLTMRGRPAQG